MDRKEDLERIRGALLRAASVLNTFSAAAVGDALRRELPRPDEGWLSEESLDSQERLDCRRVWIVDPLDGTRELLEGGAQWTVSIGLAEDGEAVAGGVYNPTTEEMFLGAREIGVTRNGVVVTVSPCTSLDGAVVLTNRWALRKRPGEFANQPFHVEIVNAMAYALALVAAGRADATWSRSPKAEWDTAAGTALIHAAGGRVTTFDGAPLQFNAWPPRAPGIIATNGVLHEPVRRFVPRLARRG